METEQVKRLRYLGMAYYRRGDVAQGDMQLADLQQRWAEPESGSGEGRRRSREEGHSGEKKSEADVAKAKDEAAKKADDGETRRRCRRGSMS